MGRGRPKNEEFRTELKRYFKQNPTASFADAARHFNVTRAHIAQLAAEIGIESSQYVSEIISEICELGDITLTDLALILDVQRPQLSRWANKQAKAQTAAVTRLKTLLDALRNANGQNKQGKVSD